MHPNISRLSWAAILFFALSADAQELAQRFKVNPKVTISLPDGWRKVNSPVGVFGMRAGERPAVFEGPGTDSAQVTIRRQRTGRYAAASVDELLQDVEEGVAEADLKKIEQQTNGLARGAEVRDLYYDEANQTVGAQFHVNITGHGGVTAMVAFFFVKDGLLEVTLVASDTAFPSLAGLFDRIVNGVNIDPEYRYNPIGSRMFAFAVNMPIKVKIALVILAVGLAAKLLDAVLSWRPRQRSSDSESSGMYHGTAVVEQPAAAPSEPALSRPRFAAGDEMVRDIAAALEFIPMVRRGELFSAGGDADLILAVELDDTLSLKEQQQTVKLVRVKIRCDRIAKIVLNSYVRNQNAAGKGLLVFTRSAPQPKAAAPAPGAAKPAAAKPGVNDGRLELDLD